MFEAALAAAVAIPAAAAVWTAIRFRRSGPPPAWVVTVRQDA